MFLHFERSLRARACSAMRVLQQDNVYVSLKLKLAVAIASYGQSIARFLLESIHTELNYGIKLIQGNNGRLASRHCCTVKLLQETKCEEPLLLFLQ